MKNPIKVGERVATYENYHRRTGTIGSTENDLYFVEFDEGGFGWFCRYQIRCLRVRKRREIWIPASQIPVNCRFSYCDIYNIPAQGPQDEPRILFREVRQNDPRPENEEKIMEQSKLKEILELHRMWLLSDPKGMRADLSSADLRCADLSYANLRCKDV